MSKAKHECIKKLAKELSVKKSDSVLVRKTMYLIHSYVRTNLDYVIQHQAVQDFYDDRCDLLLSLISQINLAREKNDDFWLANLIMTKTGDYAQSRFPTRRKTFPVINYSTLYGGLKDLANSIIDGTVRPHENPNGAPTRAELLEKAARWKSTAEILERENETLKDENQLLRGKVGELESTVLMLVKNKVAVDKRFEALERELANRTHYPEQQTHSQIGGMMTGPSASPVIGTQGPLQTLKESKSMTELCHDLGNHQVDNASTTSAVLG